MYLLIFSELKKPDAALIPVSYVNGSGASAARGRPLAGVRVQDAS
jgi:hypothetical protein